MKQITYLIALLLLGACATTRPTLKNIYTSAAIRSYYQGCYDISTKTEVDQIICKSAAQQHMNELERALAGE